MKKIIIQIIVLILFSTIVTAAYVERTIPSQNINKNAELSITLTAKDVTGNYFAIVRDDIPIGWTYVSGGSLDGNQIRGILSSLTGASLTYILRSSNFTQATVFTGTYQYTGEDVHNTTGNTTITVCTQSAEVCDAQDNDCDGLTDENVIRSCGSSNCTGTQNCTNGTWSDSCSSYLKDCGICASCDELGQCSIYTETQDNDCNPRDLPTIAICTNNPDNNPYTWDYAAGFDSVCSGLNQCTQGSYSYTHMCNKQTCNAGCEKNADCAITECDQLDKCYNGTYRNYYDVNNTCPANCSCTVNQCTVYIQSVTDLDKDTYDTECDNDCNDNNANINPGAVELCNGVDDDCDALIDEGFTDTDTDGLADCVDPDDDNDGVLDVNDDCPKVQGPADNNGCPNGPGVTIFSPLNDAWYNVSIILINVYGGGNDPGGTVQWIKESKDGGPNVTRCNDCSAYAYTWFGLGEGTHSLTIHALDYNGEIGTRTHLFYVDTIWPSILEQKPASDSYIYDLSNITFSISYAEQNLNYIKLFWNTSSSKWNNISLAGCESGENRQCSINLNMAAYPYDTFVWYYFSIFDKSGKSSQLSPYRFQLKCRTNWIGVNTTCRRDDTTIEWYNDTNSCYAKTNITSYLDDKPANSTYNCDYCIPAWHSANTTCMINNTFTEYFTDTNNCFAQTNLSSDNQKTTNVVHYCDYDKNGIVGNLSTIDSTISNLTLLINKSSNLGKNFSGMQKVELNEGNATIIEFNFNFSRSFLNLMNMSITKQGASDDAGYLVISGLDLTNQGITKTVYINKLKNSIGVCVKDEEMTSISEMSSGCNGANELFISCPGTNGNYACQFNSTLNRYKVSGLSHSGTREQETYCGDGVCSGIESCSSCSQDCGSCPAPPAPAGGGGGGGGGGFLIPASNATQATKNVTPAVTTPQISKPAQEAVTPMNFTPEPSQIAFAANVSTNQTANITSQRRGLFGITGFAILDFLKPSKMVFVIPVAVIVILWILSVVFIMRKRKHHHKK